MVVALLLSADFERPSVRAAELMTAEEFLCVVDFQADTANATKRQPFTILNDAGSISPAPAAAAAAGPVPLVNPLVRGKSQPEEVLVQQQQQQHQQPQILLQQQQQADGAGSQVGYKYDQQQSQQTGEGVALGGAMEAAGVDLELQRELAAEQILAANGAAKALISSPSSVLGPAILLAPAHVTGMQGKGNPAGPAAAAGGGARIAASPEGHLGGSGYVGRSNIHTVTTSSSSQRGIGSSSGGVLGVPDMPDGCPKPPVRFGLIMDPQQLPRQGSNLKVAPQEGRRQQPLKRQRQQEQDYEQWQQQQQESERWQLQQQPQPQEQQRQRHQHQMEPKQWLHGQSQYQQVGMGPQGATYTAPHSLRSDVTHSAYLGNDVTPYVWGGSSPYGRGGRQIVGITGQRGRDFEDRDAARPQYGGEQDQSSRHLRSYPQQGHDARAKDYGLPLPREEGSVPMGRKYTTIGPDCYSDVATNTQHIGRHHMQPYNHSNPHKSSDMDCTSNGVQQRGVPGRQSAPDVQERQCVSRGFFGHEDEPPGAMRQYSPGYCVGGVPRSDWYPGEGYGPSVGCSGEIERPHIKDQGNGVGRGGAGRHRQQQQQSLQPVYLNDQGLPHGPPRMFYSGPLPYDCSEVPLAAQHTGARDSSSTRPYYHPPKPELQGDRNGCGRMPWQPVPASRSSHSALEALQKQSVGAAPQPLSAYSAGSSMGHPAGYVGTSRDVHGGDKYGYGGERDAWGSEIPGGRASRGSNAWVGDRAKAAGE